MQAATAPILTPDQRLRVFVSSTLQELAEERTVVRKAIENIHLTPVMFELGARPHAPRNLYRQYLAQSHIFIGIYWDRYGWIAPDETISGLEDEYNLSGSLPKLIYIKQSNGQREERLTALLQRIRNDDRVSYKTFSDPAELEDLIINDLAVLLTERFNLTIQNRITEHEAPAFRSVPAVPNALIGREHNVRDIIKILEKPSVRLLTLTGPGGIGKSRLAMEVARRLECTYQQGAAFVSLAPVRDHNLVAETICYALGIKVSGGNTIDNLKLFLQDKKFLLILDNFEQVIEAASVMDDLLMASPGLKIIVTSRERLVLSFEHVYTVPALPNDCEERTDCTRLPAAMELFLQRARAIQPAFKITEENYDTICKICRRLEGLPLAIELAAGQINILSPAILLKRLDHSLDVLKGNFRDIPDRQKTMRKAIEWSFDLLSEAEQELLLNMSLYHAGCLLTTIEHMDTGSEDPFALVGALIDKSLLMKQEEDAEVRFQMLESVREFALEKLREKDMLEQMMEQQAEYYHKALQGIKVPKNQVNQAVLLRYLEKEHPNIRQVLDFLIEKQDVSRIADIGWNLWLFWWVNAHTKEGYSWLKKAWELYNRNQIQLEEHTFAILACNVGAMSFLQRDLETFAASIVAHFDLITRQSEPELVATATLITGVVRTIQKQYEEADVLLLNSLEHFRQIGLTTGISIALSALGRNAAYRGNRLEEAKAYYKESMDIARKEKNEISVILCLSGFALCEAMDKKADAKEYLRESILLSQSLHFYEALAWSIEIWIIVSANDQKLVHAITMMGAVDHLRRTAQLPPWEDLQAIICDIRKQIEQHVEPDAFLSAWNAGVEMSMDQLITFVTEG